MTTGEPGQPSAPRAAVLTDAAEAVRTSTLEHGISTSGSSVALQSSSGTRTDWRYGRRNRRVTLILAVAWNAVMAAWWYQLLRGVLGWEGIVFGFGFALIGLLLIAGAVTYYLKKLVVVVDGDRVLSGSGIRLGDPSLAPICRVSDVRAIRFVAKVLPSVLRPPSGVATRGPPLPRPKLYYAVLVLRDGTTVPLVDEIDGREAALALGRSLAQTLALDERSVEIDGHDGDDAQANVSGSG